MTDDRTSGSWPRPSGSRRSARRRSRVAPYPVNQPTIGTWLDAMGDDNERFRNGEAPPSMAQVWTMPGLGRHARRRRPAAAG